MGFISDEYESYSLSMKFKDEKLESGFVKNHHQVYLKKIGLIYLAQMAVVALLYIGFFIYFLIKNERE